MGSCNVSVIKNIYMIFKLTYNSKIFLQITAISTHSNSTTFNKIRVQFIQDITSSPVLSTYLNILGQKCIKHEYNLRDKQNIQPLRGTPVFCSVARETKLRESYCLPLRN